MWIELTDIQYAFFFSYPVVFGEDYGWNDGLVGLTFISVWIGLGLALLVTPQLEKNYRARMVAKGGKADPEDRLVGMMVGAVWVPICEFLYLSINLIEQLDSSISL